MNPNRHPHAVGRTGPRAAVAAAARAAVVPLLADLVERVGNLEALFVHEVLHEPLDPQPPAGLPEPPAPAAARGEPNEAEEWAICCFELLAEAGRHRPVDPVAAERWRLEKVAARILLDAVNALAFAEAASPDVVGRLAAERAKRRGQP